MRVYKNYTKKIAYNYLIDSGVKGCFIVYYFEARYYRAPTFTSRDPLFEKYPSISPYAYCANNPVKYVDPSGCEMEDTWVKTGDGKFVYNSTVRNDEDAVKRYGEGSKSLMNGTQCRTDKGALCTLAEGGFYSNGEFHQVEDDASFMEKAADFVKKAIYYEGGSADPGNRGTITKQDKIVGSAVIAGVISGGLAIKAALAGEGAAAVVSGLGTVNSVDDAFTNSAGLTPAEKYIGGNNPNTVRGVKALVNLLNVRSGAKSMISTKKIQSLEAASTAISTVSTVQDVKVITER